MSLSGSLRATQTQAGNIRKRGAHARPEPHFYISLLAATLKEANYDVKDVIYISLAAFQVIVGDMFCQDRPSFQSTIAGLCMNTKYFLVA